MPASDTAPMASTGEDATALSSRPSAPTSAGTVPFDAWAAERAERFEAAAQRMLPPADAVPQRLHAAMRYATLGGGKRVRPLLTFAAGAFAGGLDGEDFSVLDALPGVKTLTDNGIAIDLELLFADLLLAHVQHPFHRQKLSNHSPYYVTVGHRVSSD